MFVFVVVFVIILVGYTFLSALAICMSLHSLKNFHIKIKLKKESILHTLITMNHLLHIMIITNHLLSRLKILRTDQSIQNCSDFNSVIRGADGMVDINAGYIQQCIINQGFAKLQDIDVYRYNMCVRVLCMLVYGHICNIRFSPRIKYRSQV